MPNGHEKTTKEENSSVLTNEIVKEECSNDSLSFAENKMRTKGGGKRLGIVCFEDEDSIRIDSPSKTGSTGPESDQQGGNSLNTMLEKVESFCIKFNLKPEVTSDLQKNESQRLPDTRVEDGTQSRSSQSSDMEHTGSNQPEEDYRKRKHGRVLTSGGVEVNRKQSHLSQQSHQQSDVSEMTQTTPGNELDVHRNRSRSIRFHREEPEEIGSIQGISVEASRYKSHSNQSQTKARNKSDPVSVVFVDTGTSRKPEPEKLDKNGPVQVLSSDELETPRKASHSVRPSTRKPTERTSVDSMSSDALDVHRQMAHSNRSQASRPDESDSVHVILEQEHEAPRETSRSNRSPARESDESDSVQVIPENELVVYRKRPHSYQPQATDPSENQLEVYRERSRSDRSRAREPIEDDMVQVIPRNELDVYRKKSRSTRSHTRARDESYSVRMTPGYETETYRNLPHSRISHAREPNGSDSLRVISENELGAYRKLSHPRSYHTREPDESDSVQEIPQDGIETHRRKSHSTRFRSKHPDTHHKDTTGIEPEIEQEWKRPSQSHTKLPDTIGTLDGMESEPRQRSYHRPRSKELNDGRRYSGSKKRPEVDGTRMGSGVPADERQSETELVTINSDFPPEKDAERGWSIRHGRGKPTKRGMELTARIAVEPDEELRRSDESVSSRQSTSGENAARKCRLPVVGFEDELEKFERNVDEMRHLITSCYQSIGPRPSVTFKQNVSSKQGFTQSRGSEGFGQVRHTRPLPGVHFSRSNESLKTSSFERSGVPSREAHSTGFGHTFASRGHSRNVSRPSLSMRLGGTAEESTISLDSRASDRRIMDRSQNDVVHSRPISRKQSLRKRRRTESVESLDSTAPATRSTEGSPNLAIRRHSRGATLKPSLRKRHSGSIDGSIESSESGTRSIGVSQNDASRVHSRVITRKQSLNKRHSANMNGSVESLESEAPGMHSKKGSQSVASRVHSKGATRKRSLSKKHRANLEGSFESLELTQTDTHSKEGSLDEGVKVHSRGTTQRRSLSKRHGANAKDSVEILESNSSSQSQDSTKRSSLHFGSSVRHPDSDTSSVNSCDAFQIPDPSGRNQKRNSRVCRTHFGGIIEEYDSAGRKIVNADNKMARGKETSKRVWSDYADDSTKSNGKEMSTFDIFDESVDKDGRVEDGVADVQKAISQSLSELVTEIEEEPSDTDIAGPSTAHPSIYSDRHSVKRSFVGARGRRDALTPSDPAARVLAALALPPSCMDPERHHIFQRRIDDLKRDIQELQGELCDEQENWREKLQMMQETVSNYEKLGEIFREFL